MEVQEGFVLVVDDELLIAMSLSNMLEEIGLRVCDMAATAARAVELAQQHNPILVLMDVRLKGTADGVDAAMEIHARSPVPIIFITGSREQATLDRINGDHPAAVLIKPVSPKQLHDTVRKVLGRAVGE